MKYLKHFEAFDYEKAGMNPNGAFVGKTIEIKFNNGTVIAFSDSVSQEKIYFSGKLIKDKCVIPNDILRNIHDAGVQVDGLAVAIHLHSMIDFRTKAKTVYVTPKGKESIQLVPEDSQIVSVKINGVELEPAH